MKKITLLHLQACTVGGGLEQSVCGTWHVSEGEATYQEIADEVKAQFPQFNHLTVRLYAPGGTFNTPEQRLLLTGSFMLFAPKDLLPVKPPFNQSGYVHVPVRVPGEVTPEEVRVMLKREKGAQ